MNPSLFFFFSKDAINCAEDCVKFLCQKMLENSAHDIILMSKRIDDNRVSRLEAIGSSRFERITYTEALEILKKVKVWKSCLCRCHSNNGKTYRQVQLITGR